MVQRVLVLTNLGRGYHRGVTLGVATYASAHARNIWIPLVKWEDATDTLDDWKTHGIIGAIVVEGRGMDLAVKLGLPTVCFSGMASECPVPRVRSDDLAIGINVAEHLISAGLRNFANISGQKNIYLCERRYSGFSQRLRENGHVEVPWLWTASVDPPDSGLRDWLANTEKPVGIFASCDEIGAGIITECNGLGLRVPDDVAIVGVDNDEVLCESVYPAMSSVPHEARSVGYQAASVLTRLIAGDRSVPSLTLVPPEPIIVRGSSDALLFADPLVQEAMVFLRRHFADKIKIQSVADAVCIGRTTLDLRFKATMGCTPADTLRQLRIDYAKRLLQTTDMAMSAVSKAAGFSTARQLSESFHHLTGYPPMEYRRRTRFHG